MKNSIKWILCVMASQYITICLIKINKKGSIKFSGHYEENSLFVSTQYIYLNKFLLNQTEFLVIITRFEILQLKQLIDYGIL